VNPIPASKPNVATAAQAFDNVSSEDLPF